MALDLGHPILVPKVSQGATENESTAKLNNPVAHTELILSAGVLLEKKLSLRSILSQLLQVSRKRRKETLVTERLAELDELLGTHFLKQLCEASTIEFEESLATADLRKATLVSRTEELGYLYELSLEERSAQRGGIYYTPETLVRHMVAECLEAFQKRSGNARPHSICDPACGTGYFLTETLRQLTTDRSLIESAIKNETPLLCGVDLDQGAIKLADFCLRIEFATRFPKYRKLPGLGETLFRLRCGDSLLESAATMHSETLFTWEKDFPEVMSAGGFDIIVGNPPYGLARGEKLSAQENKILKKKFTELRAGKVNKYLLFMAQSDRLLNKNGMMSFIVPNAWLGIRAGEPMRKHWLNKKQLERIVTFQYQVFPRLSVETVVFLVNKAKKSSIVEVVERAKNDSIASRHDVHLTVIQKLGDCRIPLNWEDGVSDLVTKVLKSSDALGGAGSSFTPLIALQAYARGKGIPPQSAEDVKEHVFHSRVKETEDSYKYYRGSDIGAFSVNWSGEYLRHGPFLAEPQSLERFSGPRVAIREVLGPKPYLLSASYFEHIGLYNKSVLHILSCTESAVPRAKALTCILNSRFASFIILALGRKSQRRIFPKIVADDLKDFPLARQFQGSVEKLADLHDRVCETGGVNVAIRAEIDREVFRLYGLSGLERKLVRRFVSAN